MKLASHQEPGARHGFCPTCSLTKQMQHHPHSMKRKCSPISRRRTSDFPLYINHTHLEGGGGFVGPGVGGGWGRGNGGLVRRVRSVQRRRAYPGLIDNIQDELGSMVRKKSSDFFARDTALVDNGLIIYWARET